MISHTRKSIPVAPCCPSHTHRTVPKTPAGSQLLLAYGNSGDVEGIQCVMARAADEVFTSGVMNALVYESVLRVLAPLEAWQDAETLVKVRKG